MEGEILSNPSIVAAVLKDTVEISQDPVFISSSWVGRRGKGARRGMFLVPETDALCVLFVCLFMIAEKNWEKQEVPLGSRKEMTLVGVKLGFESLLCHLQPM